MIRRSLPALLLLASLLAFPGASAADAAIEDIGILHAGGDAVTAAVELVDNDEVLTFTAETTGNATGAQVTLRLDCSAADCPEIRKVMIGQDAAAQPGAFLNWSAELAVDDPDIVEGSWDVSVEAFDANGLVTALEAADPLVFTADDDDAPELNLVGGGTSARIGVSEDVRINVTDATLQRVTYQIAGMPAQAALPAPYILDGSSFSEGTQSVTFRAYDRAGHSSSLIVAVEKDTVAPTVVTALPGMVYAHVPVDVIVSVEETSAYEVQLSFDGEVQRATGAAGGGQHALEILTNRTGNVTFALSVVDAFDNVEFFTQTFQVAVPSTDSEITDVVRTAPEGLPLSGESVTLIVSMQQNEGVTALPMTLHWGFEGILEESEEQVLPQNGTVNRTFTQVFGAGVHRLVASLETPEYAMELNDTNQNGSLQFEVFLGRVIHDEDVYHIRAGSTGLPSEAVDADDMTYPVTFQEDSKGSRYVFDVNGTALHWDPVEQVTTVTHEHDEDKDTPAAGLLSLLALLGVALALRRR